MHRSILGRIERLQCDLLVYGGLLVLFQIYHGMGEWDHDMRAFDRHPVIPVLDSCGGPRDVAGDMQGRCSGRPRGAMPITYSSGVAPSPALVCLQGLHMGVQAVDGEMPR